MNERITRAPPVRSDGRGRIADARRRVSTAHLDMAHQQYGATSAPQVSSSSSYQMQPQPSSMVQQSYGQYAPTNNNNNNGSGYANDPQGGGPLYSIRSPAMASTARRMSRAPIDPPCDGRYYYGDAQPRGGRDVRTAAGVVAGISTNTRTTCAGASVRREHTVYAAPPREAGIVSHMPPMSYGGGNGGSNGGGNGGGNGAREMSGGMADGIVLFGLVAIAVASAVIVFQSPHKAVTDTRRALARIIDVDPTPTAHIQSEPDVPTRADLDDLLLPVRDADQERAGPDAQPSQS
nr:hypothetical protein [Pandoravirus massiliensis]